MFHVEKSQFPAAGDPNGNRTRVFAVKANLPLKLTALPQFRRLFLPFEINGLAAVWENQHPETSPQS